MSFIDITLSLRMGFFDITVEDVAGLDKDKMGFGLGHLFLLYCYISIKGLFHWYHLIFKYVFPLIYFKGCSRAGQGQDRGLALVTFQQISINSSLRMIFYITVFLLKMLIFDMTTSLMMYFFDITVKDVAGEGKVKIGDWL